MTERRWTILVVPQGSGVSRELQVSARAVKTIVSSLSFFVIAATVAIYMAVSWSVDISRVGRLESRNDILEGDLERMRFALLELADTMSVITERDREVRLLAGLTPNDTEVQQAGVGGPRDLENPSTQLLGETRLGQQALSAKEDVESLIRRAYFLAGSFREAVDSLGRQTARLQRIPSIMPTPGYLSSSFSQARLHPVYNVERPHLGIDVSAPKGTPIMAPADATVLKVGTQSGYGKIVTLDHGHGVQTRYAHCDEIMVRPGQRVKRGDEIARVGRTGVTTNYHLHYEVIVNGRHVDPRNYIFGDVIVD